MVWVNELRVSVLDCGSPLPLCIAHTLRWKSGSGLPQSKTSRNHPAGFQNAPTGFVKPLYCGENLEQFKKLPGDYVQ